MRRLQALGVRGMYYCDGMGNPLEVNYHPRHRGPRSGHAQGICRILETARQVFGAAGTECGFLYCVIPSDCIVSLGGWDLRRSKPHWPISQLCDRLVPIWQLALHGLVVQEGHGLSWPETMNKVLFGKHPRTEWCMKPGLHPVLDDAMIRALKADYDVVLGKFGYLQTLEMTDYRDLGNGAASSRFEDGTEVVADPHSGELRVNGERIARPAALPMPEVKKAKRQGKRK